MDDIRTLYTLYTLYIYCLLYQSLDDDEELEESQSITKVLEPENTSDFPLIERPVQIENNSLVVEEENCTESTSQGETYETVNDSYDPSTFIEELELRQASDNHNTNSKDAKAKRNRKCNGNSDESCGTRKKRRIWVQNQYLQRNTSGYFVQTFKKIKENNPMEFFNHTRMAREQYDELLNLVGDDLTKRSIRTPISFECRLAMTLTYLAQGVSLDQIVNMYKAGKSSVRGIILETCQVIWKCLSPLFVLEPTAEDFKNISKCYYERFNLSNCVGPIDEKYILFTCAQRKKLGLSLSANQCLSLSLSCDMDYCFTVLDLQTFTEETETETVAGVKILNSEINLPNDDMLHGTSCDETFPYYFVGSQNYALKKHIMKPYSGNDLTEEQLNFNNRVMQVHSVLDNAIGVLFARWKVLQTSMHYFPENIKTVVLATIALHNYVKRTSSPIDMYCSNTFVDWQDNDGNIILGEWHSEVKQFPKSRRVGSNNSSKIALALRDTLAQYLSTEEKRIDITRLHEEPESEGDMDMSELI